MLNVRDDYFQYVREHPQYKKVVYGAGKMARELYTDLGHIDFFCDLRAEEIGSIDMIPCVLPERLKDIPGKKIILICVQNSALVDEICGKLAELQVEAEVFHLFANPAFSFFDMSAYRYKYTPEDRLRICIVYRNDGWIFGKFARKLQEELVRLGQDAFLSEREDGSADINHHIEFARLNKFCDAENRIRTMMITHVNCIKEIDLIKFQLQHGVTGICMSEETMNRLSVWGGARERLCYVNPAQDGEIKPRKTIVGITNRCYHGIDLRKRDDMLLDICAGLEPDYFQFKIMGSGWDEIVAGVRRQGFEVVYYPEFDREIYMELMPSLDYWMYFGFDEGAMGYLDALAAGVKTITTPQGFHLDTRCRITHPCSTIDDFAKTLRQIQNEKKEIVDSVCEWTWENYARKHLEIWRYLTHSKSLNELFAHQSEYSDGIFSLLPSDIRIS